MGCLGGSGLARTSCGLFPGRSPRGPLQRMAMEAGFRRRFMRVAATRKASFPDGCRTHKKATLRSSAASIALLCGE